MRASEEIPKLTVASWTAKAAEILEKVNRARAALIIGIFHHALH